MSKKAVEQILDAALRVIAREKISGTRMHLIAKEAGMSQGSLHYYFNTKNDLMVALLDYIQEKFVNKGLVLGNSEHKTFSENLEGFFDLKKDIILNHKELDYAQIDFWVQGTVNPEVRDIWQRTCTIWRNRIKEAIIKDKNLGQTKDEDIAAYLIVSLMMGATLQYLIAEGSFDLDDYFLTAKNMVLSLFANKNAEG